MQKFGVHSEVGKLQDRAGLPSRAGPSAVDAGQRRRSAVRRRALGAGSAEGPLRLRAQDARARRRGARPARAAGRDASRTRRRAPGCSIAASPSTTSAWASPAFVRPWLDEMPAEKLAEHLIGGIAILDLPKSELTDDAGRSLRRHRLHHPAGAQHAVPARSVVLDLQRRHLQPDVLARAQARDAAAARGLQVPSALQGRRLHDLVGRFATSPSARSCMEGGDVMPIGKGVVLIGMGERTTRQAVFQVADAAVQAQGGHARDRLPDAQEPRRHAPRHGVQLLRPRPVHRVPRGRRPDPLLQRAPRRRRRRRGPSPTRAICSTW